MSQISTATAETPGRPRPDVRTPARNRWFTNKLLDAYHMQLETGYFNHKRWLLNRLVLGSGVVAGLDVLPGGEPPAVIITPGLAIDWHGREIVVPKKTGTLLIPQDVIEEAEQHQQHQQQPQQPQQQQKQQQHVIVQVQLCYREFEGDPVPADPGGDCDSGPCVAGTIYEGYEVRFAPWPAREVECGCEIQDLVANGRIDHAALARWVTRHRALDPPRNPCIALANVRIHRTGEGRRHCHAEDINIAVRLVVYSNDLLFQMLVCLNQGEGSQTYPK